MNLRRANKIVNKASGVNMFITESVLDRNIVDIGWGNGYVDVPNSHPIFGVHYDEIDVDVHGGLTYSQFIDGKWRVGFDTGHYGDTLKRWPQEKVLEETTRLFKQIVNMGK